MTMNDILSFDSSSHLLFALLVQLGLEVPDLLAHAAALLLAGLLLRLQVTLVLRLQRLHVDLQPHLLVLRHLRKAILV